MQEMWKHSKRRNQKVINWQVKGKLPAKIYRFSRQNLYI